MLINDLGLLKQSSWSTEAEVGIICPHGWRVSGYIYPFKLMIKLRVDF